MTLLFAVLDFALPSKAHEIEKVQRFADAAFGRQPGPWTSRRG
jgi:hypothetical protein